MKYVFYFVAALAFLYILGLLSVPLWCTADGFLKCPS